MTGIPPEAQTEWGWLNLDIRRHVFYWDIDGFSGKWTVTVGRVLPGDCGTVQPCCRCVHRLVDSFGFNYLSVLFTRLSVFRL